MKAIRIHQFGGSEVLHLEDIPVPEPGPGEVRVKLEAIGINFIDVYHRLGRYPRQLPITPGEEGAGIVDALGPGVTDVSPGERVVYALQTGSYAEYVIVPAAKLIPIPSDIDPQTATALTLQGLTAHFLAHDTFPLKAGHIALVHAAAGGVGLLLVQIARMRGATVIGTVSTDEKSELAKRVGATEVINYTKSDFEQEVKRLTDGKGVHVVYDSVGKTTFDKSLNCLRPLGYMVLYGQSSGPVPPFDPLILSSKGALFLTRPTLGPYVPTREALLKRTDDLFAWVRTEEIGARIAKTFPLAEASAAHDYLEGRKALGKILLVP